MGVFVNTLTSPSTSGQGPPRRIHPIRTRAKLKQLPKCADELWIRRSMQFG